MAGFETNIEERIKKAKKKARDIFYGTTDSLESEIMRLRLFISRQYSIPFFSDYFNDRTLDDLIFETELLYLATVPADQKTTDVVKEMRKESDAGNKTELDSLFDDLIEDNKNKVAAATKAKASTKSEWADVSTESNAVSDDSLDEIEKAFLETGNFTGDKNERE